MKIGVSVSIDVTKIDKDRLFKGQKGVYLDLTTFIDTESVDKYDNHGFISQSTTKEEREQGIRAPILGNCKVFFKSEGDRQYDQQQATGENMQRPHEGNPQDDDFIPF